MKIGTKSLLFGIHQVLWHPIVVTLAWIRLYGRPSWREFICIFIHDWGYWGKPNLDGDEGLLHPFLGARIANRLLGKEYYYLCALHSRSFAKLMCEHAIPSKLCWADKLSFCYEPWWFYFIRSKLSGEIKELYIECELSGLITKGATFKEWYDTMYQYIIDIPEIRKILYSQK